MTDRDTQRNGSYLAVESPGAKTVDAIEAAFTVTDAGAGASAGSRPLTKQAERSVKARTRRGSFARPSVPLAQWEEWFILGLRTNGNVRAGIAMAKAKGSSITRADVDLCYANNTKFRVKYDDAVKDFADSLEDTAGTLAKKDGAMLRFMLAGVKPEKYGRSSTHIHMTVQDRKTIEQLAREQGVDPGVIIADVERYLGSGN